MKRVVFFLISFLFFFGPVLASVNKISADEKQNRYPKEDVKKYVDVLKIIWADGDLAEAERIAREIGDSEVRWLSFYNIAADGYAPAGDIKKAIAYINECVVLITQISGIEELDKDAIMHVFQGIREKFLGDLIVATVESKLDSKVKINNSVYIVKKLVRPYYRFMAIEKAILRFSKKEVNPFLKEIGYDRYLDIDTDYSAVYRKDHYFLVVRYDKEGRVIQVFHQFTLQQKRELLESR